MSPSFQMGIDPCRRASLQGEWTRSTRDGLTPREELAVKERLLGVG